MYPTTLFSGVQHVRAHTLIAFVVLHVVLKATFFSKMFMDSIADPVYLLTDGLVTHSASAGLIQAVVLFGFLLAAVRLGADDLGLRRSHLLNAALVIAFLWSVAQTVSVAIGRVDGGLLDFGHSWNIGGSAFWAGTFEAFAAGAFLEEVIYRGFLLPQVFLLIRSIWKWNLSKSLVAATVVTQCYFAINHLPAALRMNLPSIEIGLYLTQVFFVGVLFVAIYLRTGNLFVAIGIHALLNFPGELFVSRLDPSFVVLVVSCAILLSWPYLSRLLGDVFTLRPSVAQLAHTPQAG